MNNQGNAYSVTDLHVLNFTGGLVQVVLRTKVIRTLYHFRLISQELNSQ